MRRSVTGDIQRDAGDLFTCVAVHYGTVYDARATRSAESCLAASQVEEERCRQVQGATPSTHSVSLLHAYGRAGRQNNTYCSVYVRMYCTDLDRLLRLRFINDVGAEKVDNDETHAWVDRVDGRR
jgi:hypothetical protein